MNQGDILKALDQQFSTNVSSIFINSLNKEVAFRDITLKEQKTLTKLIIDNDGREDIIYEATLAMIKSLCLDESFDSLDLTEFDRLKILMLLYRQNFFDNKIKYTCEYCNHNGEAELNFDEIVEKLNDIDVTDKNTEIITNTHKFIFTLGFPNVKNVRAYFKQMYKEKKDKNVINKLGSIDYIDLFIKNIEIENLTDSSTLSINLLGHSINDVELILEKLPQGILLNKSGNSILDSITKNFLSIINTSVLNNICGNCGKEIGLNIGFSDFFLN